MNHNPIKLWSLEDRPREKLLLKGKESLSDAELIAILLGSGSINESAVSLAKRILIDNGNDLNVLGKLSVKELVKYKGIGVAKAVCIASALELGRRRQLTDIKEKPKVQSSVEAYHLIAPTLIDLPHEEFWVILLNRACRVLSRHRISTGGTSGTVVDVKIILKLAIEHLASRMILVHNHPSGSLQPSREDCILTSKLVEAGKSIDIPVADHLIISDMGYYSFADEGKI